MPVPPYMQRVTAALNLSETELARLLDVKRKDLQSLMQGGMSDTAEVEIDPMWRSLASHIDHKMGELLAIREEIGRKLAKDTKKRMFRRMRIESR